MASAVLQNLTIFLVAVGFIGDIISCALPMWKVTAFVGNDSLHTIWEGLWMSCDVRTGKMECKVYDSMLALPQDLRVACALVVISILIVFLGLTPLRCKCTNCVEDESKSTIVSGVLFIIGGILCFIPVSWSAYEVICNSPMRINKQMELGPSLFIGWGSAGLFFIGGALLCQCHQEEDSRNSAKYSAPHSTNSGGAHV